VAAFAAGRITVEGEIDADGAGRSGPGGRAGGVVFVEAQEVVGRGAIHARGDPGATDRPGGDGGTLWLDAPAVDVALDVSSGVDAVSGRILRVPDRP
ncbi:MAG: hypothetical protein ABMB14_37240, partial [Myxococcota bacterium]